MINRCLQIAELAHDGQYRKFTKEPYINHPIRVSNNFNTEYLKCIALLHDVLEDSDFTSEDLLGWGVGEEIIDVVYILSRKNGESYFDFIMRCLNNNIATIIKIADIRDNLINLHPGSMRDKYELALYILERGKNEI